MEKEYIRELREALGFKILLSAPKPGDKGRVIILEKNGWWGVANPDTDMLDGIFVSELLMETLDAFMITHMEQRISGGCATFFRGKYELISYMALPRFKEENFGGRTAEYADFMKQAYIVLTM